MTDSKFTALEKQVAVLSAQLATLQNGFIARNLARPAVKQPPKGTFKITSRKAKKGNA